METPVKTPKPKFTFMLHDPETFKSLGKYVSTDARYSALKAASRGIKTILLRKTNSKIIHKYSGDIVTLDTPQIVKRGDREIKYSKKPAVKFLEKFVYQGTLDLDAAETEDTKE
jgi:nucleotidyltransferase/DNA polymerase involved in DNA repair